MRGVVFTGDRNLEVRERCSSESSRANDSSCVYNGEEDIQGGERRHL
jgi:hypothetical protein